MKILILGGASRVGSHIAFTLLLRNIPFDELILYDITPAVEGEAMDLRQAAAALGVRRDITWSTNAADGDGADIVIVCSGVSLSAAGTTDRGSLVTRNAQIISQLFTDMTLSSHTLVFVITNPVDVMTFHVASLVGDRKRVLGVSTLTDTSRLHTMSKGYVIGEHAGHMVVVGSNIAGEEITKLGNDVVLKKGGTWFTTPIGITNLIHAMIANANVAFPLSVVLDGEYGLHNIALSVPCSVNRQGVKILPPVDLKDHQKKTMQKAVASIRRGIAHLPGQQPVAKK